MLSLSCTLHFYFHLHLAVCKVPARLNSLRALYIINTLCKLRRLHLFFLRARKKRCYNTQKNLCAQTMHAFATRRAFRFLFCCAPARLTHAWLAASQAAPHSHVTLFFNAQRPLCTLSRRACSLQLARLFKSPTPSIFGAIKKLLGRLKKFLRSQGHAKSISD